MCFKELKFRTKLLVSLLCLFQILDGLFTFLGVQRFGLEAEGNPIVKYFIVLIGLFPALFLLKSLSAVLILFLGSHASSNAKVEGMLYAIFLFYLYVLAAWVYVLSI